MERKGKEEIWEEEKRRGEKEKILTRRGKNGEFLLRSRTWEKKEFGKKKRSLGAPLVQEKTAEPKDKSFITKFIEICD